MAALKYLLWDVDGTLADTERDGHRAAFNMAFEEAGLARRWDIPGYGELLAVAGGKERIRLDIERGDMPEMSAAEIAALHGRKTIHYKSLIAGGCIPLRPGVRRLLDQAYQAGVTLGVATTTAPAALHALISHALGAAWLDRFAVLAAGDIVAAKKPAPDIYLYAMAQLGAAPADTLALEDSANGWQSARAAGLKCVVTVNDYTRDHDFTGADLVVSELGEADSDAVRVLLNPHGLNVHHVEMGHLEEIMHA